MPSLSDERPKLTTHHGVLPGLLHAAGTIAGTGLIALVRGYQVVLRPLLIGSCNYCPTCSEYFIEAVRKHGAWRGGLLGLRRLLRCHPFGPGGIDPVP